MSGFPPSMDGGIVPLGEGGAPVASGGANYNYNMGGAPAYAPPGAPATGTVTYGGVTAQAALAKPPTATPSCGNPQGMAAARPPAVPAGATPDLSPAQLERNKRACPQCRGAGCELCAWGYRDTTLLCRQCRGSGCASCNHTGNATVWQKPARARPPRTNYYNGGGGGGGCCHCHSHGCHGSCGGRPGGYRVRPAGHPGGCMCDECRCYRANAECTIM